MTSRRNTKSDILIPGWHYLDWHALEAEYPPTANPCYLVALSEKQISVLLSLTASILPWYWLWGLNKSETTARAAVISFKQELENCLMSGCDVSKLIDTQRMLVAALTGQAVDLTTDLPTNYNPGAAAVSPTITAGSAAVVGSVDAHATGNNLGFENLTESVEFVYAKLDEIRAAIEAGDPDSLADELDDITTTISTVAAILGAVV